MLHTEAKAIFLYVVGTQTGEITVGGLAKQGKSDDDWKISLALDAGAQISKQHNTDINSVLLSLVGFVSPETDKAPAALDAQSKAFNAAINYAIDAVPNDAAVFLTMWREGNWKGIEIEFPDFDLKTVA